MVASKRIVVNTLAQYFRTVFNTVLALYSTRLVLSALGQYDFGLYALIGGVITMLGFITNAMLVTTQRHLSFSQGNKDSDKTRRVFANSLLLHLSLGLLLIAILLAISSPVINSLLQIDPQRKEAASIVYTFAVLSLFVTFITAPYRALFIANENIVYISVIDVLDALFKVLLAIWLCHIDWDRLITYSWMMFLIIVFNLLAFGLYGTYKYSEARIRLHKSEISLPIIKEITGFAGWTIYSMGCVIGRTQGVGVLLNRFFGAVINSSYGIANQVFSSIQFVAQAIQNAMSPQIFKAEGAGDRQKMLLLAGRLSRFCFMLMAMITIPLLFELPSILELWLGKVPAQTTVICSFILLASVMDQLTVGLGIANQAIGKIRNYSLVVNTTKILTLPAAWLCLKAGNGVTGTMVCFLVFEVICAAIRLPFLRITANLCIKQYVKNTIVKATLPAVCQTAMTWIIITVIEIPFRFALSIPLSILLSVIPIWCLGLTSHERGMIRQYYYSRTTRLKTNNE